MATCYNRNSGRNYAPVSKQLARERAVSLAARGLALYVLSHEETTDFTPQSLAEANGCSADEVQAWLRELAAAGYLVDGVITDQPAVAHV